MEGAAIRPWWGRLDLAQIRVAAGETLEAGTLFETEALRLHWSWKALLRRSIVLDRITLVRPRLTLHSTVTSAAGTRDLFSVFLQPRTGRARSRPGSCCTRRRGPMRRASRSAGRISTS